MRRAQHAIPSRRTGGIRRDRSSESTLQKGERQSAEAVGALGEKGAAIDAEGVARGIEAGHGGQGRGTRDQKTKGLSNSWIEVGTRPLGAFFQRTQSARARRSPAYLLD